MIDTLARVGIFAAVALAAWALFTLRDYFVIGAGYKAKVLCTGVFGSGRDLDPQHADQVSADSYWLLRPFSAHVDVEARRVTTSFMGFTPRVAVHRDGLGATLLDRGLHPLPTERLLRPSASPAHDWPSGAEPDAVRRVVDDAFDEPDRRRLRRTYAVVVVHDGRLVAERYAPGITADTPLPGWSMAKSVLSALVGLLVDEGRLALDSRELVPAWRSPDARAAITLDDLLRMRSGLRFSENYGHPWSNVVQMLYNSGDMAACAAACPLASRPGAVWSYSSGTSNILSGIVRRIVGDEGYHLWPRRALFDRVGMRSMVLEPDASGTFVGSSYALATARDWARFGQLWLDGGQWEGRQILSPAWVRHCATPTPESPDLRYGAHWWLKLNPDMGGDTADARQIASDATFAVGHEGQTLTVIPSSGLVVVRLGGSIYIDAWNHARFIARLQAAV